MGDNDRDEQQPADGDLVAAVLVFLDLLVGKADGRSQLFLRQPEPGPAGAQALADHRFDRARL